MSASGSATVSAMPAVELYVCLFLFRTLLSLYLSASLSLSLALSTFRQWPSVFDRTYPIVFLVMPLFQSFPSLSPSLPLSIFLFLSFSLPPPPPALSSHFIDPGLTSTHLPLQHLKLPRKPFNI